MLQIQDMSTKIMQVKTKLLCNRILNILTKYFELSFQTTLGALIKQTVAWNVIHKESTNHCIFIDFGMVCQESN